MKINIPDICPVCSSKLELVNEQLFCRNKSCPAQLNAKLEHFCKVLGIKGMGPKTIEKLQLSDIPELFYLDEDEVIDALGSEKVAKKLLDEIERSKTATLDTILASFSIPLIGGVASKKITSVVSHIDEITVESCKEAGLGEKATSNLLNWLSTEFAVIRDSLPFDFNNKVKSVNQKAETICITGKLSSFKTKAEATQKLEERGYKVTETITKTTSYLVDEENKGSSKRKKAEEYNIKIIDNLITFLE